MSSVDPSRHHFHELTHPEQVSAVRHMAQSMSEVGIAMATGWSVEYIAHVLGEQDAHA